MSIGSMLVRHEPASAAVVRHQLADDLRLQGVPQLSIDDVLLVATELVGNAIVHSTDDGDVGVVWDVAPDGVTVRVEDHSEEQPRPRRAEQHAPDGRGLAIVAALACEWGVTCAPGGKQVWARIPVRADSHRQTA